MNVRRTGLVVIVSGLLAAGCSQPGSPSASVAAPSASVVEPSASTASSGASTSPSSPSGSSGVSLDGSPFLGTYSTTIPAGGAAPPGTWKLTVSAAGMQFVHPDGHTFSPGPVVAVTADEFTLGPDPGCPNQTTPGPGRYSWSLDGGTLTIKELDPPDTCRDRAATLTEGQWKAG